MAKQDRWSYQPELVDAILARAAEGHKRILAVAPTGAGKTRIISMLAEGELERGGRVVVYTNRRVIHDQIVEHLSSQGHEVGVRLAGAAAELWKRLQVSSVQTDYRRCIKGDRWDLHDATLVLQDEAHSNANRMAAEIHRRHVEAGAVVVGLTATPIGVKHMYDVLVNGPTKSLLRARGVLVKCLVWAPVEIDLRGIKIVAGEYDKTEFSERLLRPVVFGDVIDSYRQINPEQRPTILFAPGVRESIWFRDQFRAAGVPSEHIDADTDRSDRDRMFGDVREGRVKLLTSCGVLREGFDLPIISHAILCQPTRKLRTYIQMVGRILRAAPDKGYATLQDHVAAWHRLGSPNEDHDWKLEDDDDVKMTKERKRKIDDGEIRPPVCCPSCGQIRVPIPPRWDTCPCGYKGTRSSRKVRTKDGRLVKMNDKPPKPKPKRDDATEKARNAVVSSIYQGMYKNMTGGQITVMAITKNDGHPIDPSCGVWLPQPNSGEWHLRARDIPEWDHFWKSIQRRRAKR